jgi:hypothetical protein
MPALVYPAPSGIHVARHEADSKRCGESNIEKPTREAEFRNCLSPLYQLVTNWAFLSKSGQPVLIPSIPSTRYAIQFALVNRDSRLIVRGGDNE